MVFTGMFGLVFTFLPVLLIVVGAVMPIVEMDKIGDFCVMLGSILLIFNRPYAVWTCDCGTKGAIASIFLGGDAWGKCWYSIGGCIIQVVYFLILGGSVYFAFFASDDEKDSENKDVEKGDAAKDAAKDKDAAKNDE